MERSLLEYKLTILKQLSFLGISSSLILWYENNLHLYFKGFGICLRQHVEGSPSLWQDSRDFGLCQVSFFVCKQARKTLVWTTFSELVSFLHLTLSLLLLLLPYFDWTLFSSHGSHRHRVGTALYNSLLEVTFHSLTAEHNVHSFVGTVKTWDAHCHWHPHPTQPTQCGLPSETWIHTGKLRLPNR